MGVTSELVNSCRSLTYKDFSPEIIDKVKYLTLDFLGVASRGSIVESTRPIYDMIRGMGLNTKGGVIIGTDIRALHQYAALANGSSAHSLEMDDVNNEASLHPGVAIFPAAFAAAELTGADGKRFIEGVVVGYEVMVRLGKALNPAKHYARGFHPTGTCGAFGAAAAVSKILNLNGEQMISALGIAGSQAAGSMEFLANGVWTKRFHPGWAAHNGILAAFLAQKGFKGPSSIIEGRFGFLHSYSDDSDLNKVLANFRQPFEIVKTSIKPHACCRYEHGPIDGILKIMKENNLKAEEVAEVTLGILKAAFPIVVEPKESKYNPKTVVDAQFSMPFGAAVAILYGKASLNEHIPENITSTKIKEIMSLVSCVEDPELDKVYPKQWPASVKVVTKDGRIFSTKVDYPKGDPENPLSWEELLDKFNELSSPIYPKERRDEIISQVRLLETVGDISNLTTLFLKQI